MRVPQLDMGDRKTQLAAAGAATAAIGGAVLLRAALRRAKPKQGRFKPDTLPAGAYDVAIVGAGARLRDQPAPCVRFRGSPAPTAWDTPPEAPRRWTERVS